MKSIIVALFIFVSVFSSTLLASELYTAVTKEDAISLAVGVYNERIKWNYSDDDEAPQQWYNMFAIVTLDGDVLKIKGEVYEEQTGELVIEKECEVSVWVQEAQELRQKEDSLVFCEIEVDSQKVDFGGDLEIFRNSDH